ncbi:hypothetical protein P153DRAFT_391797 [Dothidotthia symphoricarpi CBS 119687]|uniref:Uncharacterized protein n=1 Tax=Dothidotthia symphoricarpi CBS 119687 TaxID=1392245 RepID=A0A6A6ASB4_9PLEO|nr:uncharacterized protein P153DRAFT_391797 [Dothidotthia symphoricarpi CBS 119687]KAF2134456.1 hypothetical protein P153DRAFT_391797 [Dothidotthia symphoricarpi CBS 119687]
MARRCGYNRYNQYVCYKTSAWNTWARWVVLGVIVLAFLMLFFICSCLTARKRRKAGHQPYYGTGWAARPPAYGETQGTQPYYNNNNNTQGNAAPPYSATTSNQGYYGNQPQSNVELQQPQQTYGGAGQNMYAPPPGPPPGKTYNGV